MPGVHALCVCDCYCARMANESVRQERERAQGDEMRRSRIARSGLTRRGIPHPVRYDLAGADGADLRRHRRPAGRVTNEYIVQADNKKAI